MTIRKLKELIKDLPDDMRICADDRKRKYRDVYFTDKRGLRSI